ncbi:hypothetical protein XENOCAPTIV_020180, partial [Xenoophorus captivus]
MSSDEEGPTSPVFPIDSDRGSSVSSELQDEYEELLRYAVVTPKFETLASTQWKGPSSQRKDDLKVQHLPDPETEDGRHSSRSTRSSQASPVIVELSTHSKAPLAERTAGQSSSRASVLSDAPSENLQTTSKRSSPDFRGLAVTEMFISEENISKMESILDTWSNNLK